jgi:hypothetical protein
VIELRPHMVEHERKDELLHEPEHMQITVIRRGRLTPVEG